VVVAERVSTPLDGVTEVCQDWVTPSGGLVSSLGVASLEYGPSSEIRARPRGVRPGLDLRLAAATQVSLGTSLLAGVLNLSPAAASR
jgi:hypothetical protein